MKITVLAENTSRRGLPCEHGLSLYIELDGKTILFDTGQSGLFADNARLLGADLAKVDFAVLSHGHYDHGGGLMRFFELNDTAPVYMSEYAFEPHFNSQGKYIGLDSAILDSGRVVFTHGETPLTDNVTLYSGEDMPKIADSGSAGLCTRRGQCLVSDDFRHEHYMIIEEGGRRVLFSGYSHRGIVNIMNSFEPDVMVGGFHLSGVDTGDALAEYAQMLAGYPAEYYTCHCTGVEQYIFMKNYIGSLGYISTGDTAEIR